MNNEPMKKDKHIEKILYVFQCTNLRIRLINLSSKWKLIQFNSTYFCNIRFVLTSLIFSVDSVIWRWPQMIFYSNFESKLLAKFLVMIAFVMLSDFKFEFMVRRFQFHCFTFIWRKHIHLIVNELIK